MKYQNVVRGRFVDRPNRFIAHVEIEGKIETVHVKNTGRCRELLLPGATVYLEKGDAPKRKTAYDLIAVEKGERMVNMDSQAPNKAVKEWLLKKELFPGLVFVRPETTYGQSRFDFYIETDKDRIFMEVKGVTLEEDGVMRFPDAPSERAIKHVEELAEAVNKGYKAYILFVIQMKGAKYFTPHRDMHPDFAAALEKARDAGVEIIAYDCQVTPDGMEIDSPVKVRLTEDVLEEIERPLLSWYDAHRRILPWRENPTPYNVWVSEIMLQQTRVEAVKPYFKRFMESLPSIKNLAYAEENKLLKLWEGLGYYNRVRNLQKAALQIEEEYGGKMPEDYEEILKLKGIGSYTAGAISSIAFGKPYPAVDGNVLRVISRLRMDDADILSTRTKSRVEQDLRRIMPEDRPGDFNQAMMEIGAMVCVPNGAPHCADCPFETMCMAHRAGVETKYPKKAEKKKRSIEKKTVLVIRDENKAALSKRPEKGLLAGLYEFPTMEGHRSAKEVVSYLKEKGLLTIRIQPLLEAKHIFSHKEWHMIGYMVRVDELAAAEKKKPEDWLFVEPERTEKEYPIPSAFSAYTDYLNIKLGNEKYKEN
ncbi:MAG: A/G-specific adenine glycosylase [Lachnospiraceae bacterium]|nr:A/G-specific adenine glycosylase [Lachnospiraceae bacterium]